ncbi:MAG TPA: hypothetical protein VG253_10185, partial [Streptosporangiaceae bacterium]|nr:hypothetical protein [Streptosporangiaceae bacterium]
MPARWCSPAAMGQIRTPVGLIISTTSDVRGVAGTRICSGFAAVPALSATSTTPSATAPHLDQPALFQHPHPVGERKRFRLIVGDVDGGGTGLADERGDLHPHSL